MEFLAGVVLGIAAAIVVVGVATYFFLRESPHVSIPDRPPVPAEPAITATLAESFLNDQLQEALKVHTAGSPFLARGPFEIKLDGARIALQPESSASCTALLTASALGVRIRLAPVAQLSFVPQAGRVKIIVTKVQIHGVNVPRNLVEQSLDEIVSTAEEKINLSLEHLKRDTHLELRAIETAENTLILKFS